MLLTQTHKHTDTHTQSPLSPPSNHTENCVCMHDHTHTYADDDGVAVAQLACLLIVADWWWKPNHHWQENADRMHASTIVANGVRCCACIWQLHEGLPENIHDEWVLDRRILSKHYSEIQQICIKYAAVCIMQECSCGSPWPPLATLALLHRGLDGSLTSVSAQGASLPTALPLWTQHWSSLTHWPNVSLLTCPRQVCSLSPHLIWTETLLLLNWLLKSSRLPKCSSAVRHMHMNTQVLIRVGLFSPSVYACPQLCVGVSRSPFSQF